MSEIHQTDKENQLIAAQEAVEYYKHRIADQQLNNEQPWFLGLFMAMQWVRFITEPHPNAEELRAFVQVLDVEKDRQGHQWHYMWRRVKEWA